LKARSLRLRLLFGAAAWVALALLAAGALIGFLFTENVERAARAELSARLTRLVAAIDPQSQAVLAAVPLSDPRYETPFSGAYWQVEDLRGRVSVRSRSLWDEELDAAGVLAPGEHYRRLSGPGGQSLLALSMLARFKEADGEKAYRITVAEDRAILDEATERFGRSLAWALAALGLALIGAAWLQVRVGLSPLSRLREGIGVLRRGTAEEVPGSYPSEVMPLVAEMNELLASQAKSMDFARARAADLAHGLKTPLSVLAGVADRLRENGDAETAATLDELTGEMADRIDYQLRLSRLRMRSRAQHLSAPLDRAVERTVAVLKKTRDGERVDWRIEVAAGLTVDVDPHDLVELVGVLLENAAQWACKTVSVSAAPGSGHAELVIADDGPGIGDARPETLGLRGRRLDEAKPGSGLGLAIAREIIALNDGTLELADDRGLRVTVRLPLTGGGYSMSPKSGPGFGAKTCAKSKN